MSLEQSGRFSRRRRAWAPDPTRPAHDRGLYRRRMLSSTRKSPSHN